MSNDKQTGAALLTRYKKALEGLTPGGSEFVDDPERCAEHVRKRLDFLHGQLLKAKGAAPRAKGARPETWQQWRTEIMPEVEAWRNDGDTRDAFVDFCAKLLAKHCVMSATGAREAAERIVRLLQELHELRQEPEIVAKLPTLIDFFEQIICDNIAACQSAAPSPEQLSNAWRRYQELFGAAPHGTAQQMGALLELIPAPAGMRVKFVSDERLKQREQEELAACPSTPAGGERPQTVQEDFYGDCASLTDPEPPQGAGEQEMCRCPYAKDQSVEWHPVGSPGCNKQAPSAPDETRAGTPEWPLGLFCENHIDTTLADANVSDPCPLCAAYAAAAPSEAVRAARDLRQREVAEWCAAAFGAEHQSSVPQRGLRMLEEAIEAYQSATLGLPAPEMREKAHALVDYVFDRVSGNLAQECGGVGLTLLALCEAAGISAETEELREIARVKSKPLEHFRQRNQVKNDAGFAVARAEKALEGK